MRSGDAVGPVDVNATSIYKQLQDYRDSRRSWGVMGAIAKVLTPNVIRPAILTPVLPHLRMLP